MEGLRALGDASRCVVGVDDVVLCPVDVHDAEKSREVCTPLRKLLEASWPLRNVRGCLKLWVLLQRGEVPR